MTIGITGASGGLGRATAELLLAAADPAQVVLTTRHPETLSDLASRGADVRHADFNDPAGLKSAFAGVDRLLLVSTDGVGTRLQTQRDAISAAAAAGVAHVVYTSVPRPVPENPALVVPDHAGTEQALRESGMQWTFLRNNLYAHMQIPGLQHAAQTGHLVTNAGGGAVAYVTREDCAAAAVGVLTTEGHANTAYDITGPSALTPADLAALAGTLGGRQVDVVDVDDESYASGLVASGLPEAVSRLLASFGAAAREGFLADATSAVLDLSGRAPTSLGELARAAR